MAYLRVVLMALSVALASVSMWTSGIEGFGGNASDTGTTHTFQLAA